MANPFKRLKRDIKKLLGKGPVKAIAKAKTPEDETKRQERLRAKYPQMYRPGKLKGTRNVMARVRKADPSSVRGVGKSKTLVLKEKYKRK